MSSSKLKLPDDKELAESVLEVHSKERVLIGKLIGTNEHAPFNITLIALLIVSSLLVCVMFLPMELDSGTAFTALLGAFTAIIGFLFGKNSG